jgi:hypothetical protein
VLRGMVKLTLMQVKVKKMLKEYPEPTRLASFFGHDG